MPDPSKMQVKKDQKKVIKETKSLPGEEFITNIYHLYEIKRHQEKVFTQGNCTKAVTGAISTPVSRISKKDLRLICL